MDEVIGYIAFFGVIAGIIGLIVAVIVWVLAYICSYLVVPWSVLILVGTIGGIVTSVVLPFITLNGRNKDDPDIAYPTPELLARELPKRKGFYQHFDQDSAWMNYIPYQYRRDIRATFQSIVFTSKFLIGTATSQVKKQNGLIKKIFVVLVLIIIGAPVFLVPFLTTLWLGYGVWYLLAVIGGTTVRLIQSCLKWYSRASDSLTLKKRRADLKCIHCFAEAPRAAYRCPSCKKVHTDLRPSAQGVTSRVCSCGQSLPVTVKKAAKTLVPVCPSCYMNLVEGTGSRQTIVLPVFGAPSAGKTRLLAATIVRTKQQLVSLGGNLVGLTQSSKDFVGYSEKILKSRTSTAQTTVEQPVGQPLLLTSNEESEVELQFVDAAGEFFKNESTSEKLTYIDAAPLMIFVFDPISLPALQREAQETFNEFPPAATNDQIAAFTSVVERIRNQGLVDLKERTLGFVLSKADIASSLPSGKKLASASDHEVSEWMNDMGQSGFLRMIEATFKEVKYFAIDSFANEFENGDSSDPLRLTEWIFSELNSVIAIKPEESEAKTPQSEESEVKTSQ